MLQFLKLGAATALVLSVVCSSLTAFSDGTGAGGGGGAGTSGSGGRCLDVKQVESGTKCHSPRKCTGGGEASASVGAPIKGVKVQVDMSSDSDDEGEECCRILEWWPAHTETIDGDWMLSDPTWVDGTLQNGECETFHFLWLIPIGDPECKYGDSRPGGKYELRSRKERCGDPPKSAETKLDEGAGHSRDLTLGSR